MSAPPAVDRRRMQIWTDMMNFSEISIEVEQDLYDEVSVLCRNAGTSVEALTAAFLSSALSPKISLRSRFFWEKKK